jgi:hypothetical protein
MEPPVQTFNKVSRLGWPHFTNPDNKSDILREDFAEIKEHGIDSYGRCFVIVNIRLQAESKKKLRLFNFLDAEGNTYAEEIKQDGRIVQVKGIGPRVCSRVRLIFNMPVLNLYKQALDTAIHHVFLKYPAFSHDMFNNRILPVTGRHVCLDVKHFERFTADAVRHRAVEVIGGLYGQIGNLFSNAPWLLPTDDWDDYFYVRVNRGAGYSDQFSSGDSGVAPSQKEIITALYGEFFKRTRGLTYQEAINMVFRGGDDKLTLRDYGDDQSISGDSAEIDAVMAFLNQYLTVEIETPPKFLGFVWYNELGWKLPIDSYLLKTYLNERRPYSSFRQYPNLGWVLKREVFLKHGHPDIAREVYPVENELLAAHGLPWSEIIWKAEKERKLAASKPGVMIPNYVLGKDWAMTPAEKLSTGEFIGLQPAETAVIIKSLLDKRWLSKLKW